MTVKERISERLGNESAMYRNVADEIKAQDGECETEMRFRWISNAYSRSIAIINEEFAKEVEESTPIYIIEFRPKGGKWQIFDMDGDRSRERAESYIPSNQVSYPGCEFRVVKYQRVEGE